MGGAAGRAPSGGLRSCACSRTGWGRHHHHHDYDSDDNDDEVLASSKLISDSTYMFMKRIGTWHRIHAKQDVCRMCVLNCVNNLAQYGMEVMVDAYESST